MSRRKPMTHTVMWHRSHMPSKRIGIRFTKTYIVAEYGCRYRLDNGYEIGGSNVIRAHLDLDTVEEIDKENI